MAEQDPYQAAQDYLDCRPVCSTQALVQFLQLPELGPHLIPALVAYIEERGLTFQEDALLRRVAERAARLAFPSEPTVGIEPTTT